MQPTQAPSLPTGEVNLSTSDRPTPLTMSTMTKDEFLGAVDTCKVGRCKHDPGLKAPPSFKV